MADHFSGPRALADPASDITDVFTFPSPERPGHLVLVLDVFPSAAATALFSDALRYRFRLRPVTVTTAGGTPAFVPGAEEYLFDVSFAVSSPEDGAVVQAGTCTTPSGSGDPVAGGARRSPPRCTACGSSPGRDWIRSSSTWLPSRPPTNWSGWCSGLTASTPCTARTS